MPAKKPNRIASAHELAITIREGVSPRLYVEWQLTILEGCQPELVRGTKGDSSTWYVRPKRGGTVPSAEDQLRALKDLMDRGYGQAVQAIALQGELRTLSLNASLQLPTGQISPKDLEAIARILLPAGAPASATASDHDDDAIDAECVEAPASASDDDQDLEQPAPATASDHDDADDE